MKTTLIWIGALVVGAILGLLGLGWLDEVMNFVATVYTRLFQLLAVPTIVLAVITTFATFGSKGSGKIFGHTLTYTLLTTFAAAAVGAILYVLIAPGNLPVETISNSTQSSDISPQTSYIDHIVSIIPNNIVKPFLDGNVLSLLLLAFAIGFGLSKLPESENKAVVVKGLLGLQELLFLLIRGLIWTLPLGIVAFAAQLSAQVSAGVVADSIGKYVLVVLGGNVIQFFVVLPLFLLARGLNPIHVFSKMTPAVLMALFTKSSAATLPVTMDTAENRLGIRKNVARFVLPICTTINMNGCALRDATGRYPHHPKHHPTLDSDLRHLRHRQCRRTDGLLFPHAFADVWHRRTYRRSGYHPTYLYYYRYGGNGRKCVV
jgi:Na+/H+-dicarboxylate symporter